MQGRHRALAFGNIQHGPDKADGLPVHVEQDAPTRQQPARPAAHADDGTVSNGVVAALFGIERLLDRFMCLHPVVRMHTREKHVVVDFRVVRQPEEAFAACRPVHEPRHGIIVPRAQLRGLHRQTKSFFAQAELLDDLAPLADVFEGCGSVQHLPLGVPDDRHLREHGETSAVFPDVGRLIRKLALRIDETSVPRQVLPTFRCAETRQ